MRSAFFHIKEGTMRKPRRSFIFATALILILFCTQETWAQGAISVNPPGLGFPGVGIGCTVTKNLTIRNVGTSALIINNITLNNNYFNRFSFSGPTPPVTLQPEFSIDLQVSFTPAYDTIETANIRIDSTAPSSPTIVYMTGDSYNAPPSCTGQQGYLEINPPNEISFGPVTIGDPGFLAVKLIAHNADVTLTDISIQSESCPGDFRWYSLTEFFELPYTVPRNTGSASERNLFLRFDPANEGQCMGKLHITTDPVTTPAIEVQLQGEGYGYCNGPVFDDVSCPHWAFHYIMSLYYTTPPITSGCSEVPKRYCPDDIVTREQMAKFIIQSLDVNPNLQAVPPDNYCGTENPFNDVPFDSWSCKYVKRLAELGITSGYGNGIFGPFDPVTREQMAAFLIRALDEVPADEYCGTSNPFTDVSYDRWSCKYVKRLLELGVTTGYGDGRFGPDDYVTRAQMAVFLKRAFLDMHWKQ
jgi:hypothetical protein